MSEDELEPVTRCIPWEYSVRNGRCRRDESQANDETEWAENWRD